MNYLSEDESPPFVQDRQTPNVLPFPRIFVHRPFILANSEVLKLATAKGVSVVAKPVLA